MPREWEFCYCYHGPSLKVATITEGEPQSTALVDELTQKLRRAVPFRYDIPLNGGPNVHQIGGGLITVEMIICPRGMSREEASEELLAKGFWVGLKEPMD